MKQVDRRLVNTGHPKPTLPRTVSYQVNQGRPFDLAETGSIFSSFFFCNRRLHLHHHHQHGAINLPTPYSFASSHSPTAIPKLPGTGRHPWEEEQAELHISERMGFRGTVCGGWS